MTLEKSIRNQVMNQVYHRVRIQVGNRVYGRVRNQFSDCYG